MQILSSLLAVVAAYLIGSLSFAVIVSRLMGLSDPRSYGSGNPGATNVLRSGNKKAAVLTLLFDALKGLLPVLAAQQLQGQFGWGETTLGFVGLAAFVGHLWPVFFRFQGGKGVATAIGVLLGLVPVMAGVTLLVWLVVAYLTRYSSLAAIVAAIFVPFGQLLTYGASPVVLAIAVMSLLLVWRHDGNIRKLLAGTESKIGQKAAPVALPPAPDVHAHAHAHKTSHPNRHQRKGKH
jgi:glycerol-3-phosphate acyltransferase PlsY